MQNPPLLKGGMYRGAALAAVKFCLVPQYIFTMLVLEAKLKGKTEQYQALDEAIRTANFVRNKALPAQVRLHRSRGIGWITEE